MTLMLEALKRLEGRQAAPSAARELARSAPSSSVDRREATKRNDATWEAASYWPLPSSEPVRAAELPVIGPATQARPTLRLEEAGPGPVTSIDADLLPEYRALRDRILLQCRGIDSPVLIFPSVRRIDATHFSLTALASTMVEASRGDVLLVNGDRRGALASLDETASPVGLAEAMAGTIDWSQVARPTKLPGVWLTSAFMTAAHLSSPQRIDWTWLRRRFRCILVDSAAATDALTVWLAAQCDAAYFVVALHDTRRKAALKAIETLERHGARVAGCVVADACDRDG